MRTYWIVRLRDWATGRYRWSGYHVGDSTTALRFELDVSRKNPRADTALFGFDYAVASWRPSSEIGYSSYYMGALPLEQALGRFYGKR
jgi:hypothetical protein